MQKKVIVLLAELCVDGSRLTTIQSQTWVRLACPWEQNGRESEKSAGITSAPAACSGSELEPVPAARSKIFIPGFGAIVAVVALRHLLVCPRLKMSLTRS